MSWLVDGNTLLALALRSHPLHPRAKVWFETLTDLFYTCSVTEGTLLRLHMRLATDTTAATAWRVLSGIQAGPHAVYLDDGFSYQQVSPRGLLGHKQVTDAWLAQLAAATVPDWQRSIQDLSQRIPMLAC